MKIVLASLGIFILAVSGVAQAKPAATPATDKGKTDLELFSEKYGTVVVQGYTRLPSITTTGGRFTATVKEYRTPSGTKVKGLVFEVDDLERYSSAARSFVEYGELDSLMKGIDYVSKIDKTVTTLENFEAKYSTKDEFEVTVFNGRDGKIQVAVTVGRIGSKSVYLTMDQLPLLVELLTNAKAKLDTL
jgi:hypothetical protein